MDEYQFNIKASTDTNINYTYHRVTVLGFSFLVSQGIFFLMELHLKNIHSLASLSGKPIQLQQTII